MNFRKQTNYCYGHEHRSIVPFNELSKEVQDKDQEYVDALKSISIAQASWTSFRVK